MVRYLVIDTNVFLLLIVGLADKRYIKTHDNTNSFEVEDFQILQQILKQFAGIVVNQAVLAETSNLMRQYKEPGRTKIGAVFRWFVQNSCEVRIKSVAAVDRDEFFWLGFTDSVLLEMQKDSLVLLTVDVDLYRAAHTSGGFSEIWNFHHIREAKRRL